MDEYFDELVILGGTTEAQVMGAFHAWQRESPGRRARSLSYSPPNMNAAQTNTVWRSSQSHEVATSATTPTSSAPRSNSTARVLLATSQISHGRFPF